MGASSSSTYFTAYKSIKEVQKMIKNYKPLSFNIYLINTNSIKNFITIIKKNNILDHLNDDKILKELEKKLNKDLKKYQLEKNIVIYSQIEQYKKLIEKDDNKIKEENEFILVDNNFINAMNIDDEEINNKKIEIVIDNESNMKIKFPDFNKEISLIQKSNGFYSLDKIKFEEKENENTNINKEINKEKTEELSINKGGFIETSSIDKNANNNSSSIIFTNSIKGIQNKIQIDSFTNHPLSFLNNIENTFSMNIQLHILSNIPQLTNYFLSNKEKFINNKDNYKLAKAYSDIIYNIWNIDNNDHSYKINNLKSLIGEDAKLFEPKFLIPL